LTLTTRRDPATENGGEDRTATSMKHTDDGSRWKRWRGEGTNSILARGRCCCRRRMNQARGYVSDKQTKGERGKREIVASRERKIKGAAEERG
jgi:hypothetical protein